MHFSFREEKNDGRVGFAELRCLISIMEIFSATPLGNDFRFFMRGTGWAICDTDTRTKRVTQKKSLAKMVFGTQTRRRGTPMNHYQHLSISERETLWKNQEKHGWNRQTGKTVPIQHQPRIWKEMDRELGFSEHSRVTKAFRSLHIYIFHVLVGKGYK